MKNEQTKSRGQGALKKLGVLALLAVLLEIPSVMVGGVISEREHTRNKAVTEMKDLFGEVQVVDSPILRIPFQTKVPRKEAKAEGAKDKTDSATTQEGAFYAVPNSVSISTSDAHEIRKRGIFSLPVFTTSVSQEGVFDVSDIARHLPLGAIVDWARAEVILEANAQRSIAVSPSLTMGVSTVKLSPRSETLDGFRRPLASPFPESLMGGERRIPFHLRYTVKGTESLLFRIAARESEVSLRSTWMTPSFTGKVAPVDYKQDDNGFSALWRESEGPLGWIEGSAPDINSLGARFITPVDTYRMTSRAWKYDVLFFILVFSCFYLFETVSGLRIHAIQYGLVGAALVLFFLLLLSLSEHIVFEIAYAVASMAATGLVTGYSRAVLKAAGRCWAVLGIMTSLYGFLFVVLQSEDYALLLGTTGLTVQLALLMYLTRNVDWYAKEKSPQAAPLSESSVERAG